MRNAYCAASVDRMRDTTSERHSASWVKVTHVVWTRVQNRIRPRTSSGVTRRVSRGDATGQSTARADGPCRWCKPPRAGGRVRRLPTRLMCDAGCGDVCVHHHIHTRPFVARCRAFRRVGYVQRSSAHRPRSASPRRVREWHVRAHGRLPLTATRCGNRRCGCPVLIGPCEAVRHRMTIKPTVRFS